MTKKAPWDNIPQTEGLPIMQPSPVASVLETSYQNLPSDVSDVSKEFNTNTPPSSRDKIEILLEDSADKDLFNQRKPPEKSPVELKNFFQIKSPPFGDQIAVAQPITPPLAISFETPKRPKHPPPSWTSALPLRLSLQSPSAAVVTGPPSSQGTSWPTKTFLAPPTAAAATSAEQQPPWKPPFPRPTTGNVTH